jgi:hypothetical protein
MPAVTPAQQRLMAQAYQVKKGVLKPEDIDTEYREQIVKLANSMTTQQLKDFAETKHAGMKKEGKVNEWLPGVSAGHKWYTQGAQGAASYGSNIKDHTDKLIKSFLEFIETGKKPSKRKEIEITEGGMAAPTSFSAPQAAPANTPGMGNVTAPGSNTIGSGDKFGEDEEENKDEIRVGIMSYEDYKKWDKTWKSQNKHQHK